MGFLGTIVLIDDDADARGIVEDLLVDEGYRVLVAKNGREGLDLLATIERPQLILLDLMMPVMNGWDVIAALDASTKLSTLPVVLFTAAGEPSTREIALGRPLVRKPIDLDLLLAMVSRICAIELLAREAPSDLMPRRL